MESMVLSNKDGEEIIPYKYEDADAFSNRLAKVKPPRRLGLHR